MGGFIKIPHNYLLTGIYLAGSDVNNLLSRYLVTGLYWIDAKSNKDHERLFPFMRPYSPTNIQKGQGPLEAIILEEAITVMSRVGVN